MYNLDKIHMKSNHTIKVNCSQCGGWKCETIVKTKDYELNTNEKYTVSKCLTCGNIYTSIRPDMATLYTKHYPDDYRCYDENAKLLFFNIARMRIYGQASQRITILNKYLSKQKKIHVLEVGCATGEFLKLGKQKFGWEVCGIEPNKNLHNQLTKDGINIINSIMEVADVQKNYYDAVCLFNVFEHLWDSSYSLRRINSFLKQNGLVILEIPDFDATSRNLFGKYWFLYHLPRHLTHLNKSMLNSLMNKNGFKQVATLKQFRPTVNSTSLKYYLREKIRSKFLQKFISENNPILLSFGIILEMIFNLFGTSNHIVAIFKKTTSVKVYKSLMKIKEV